MATTKTIVVFDPTSKPKGEELKTTPRLTKLEGTVLGALWNSKPNGDILLDRIVQLLDERVHFSEIIREKKDDKPPMKTSALDERLVNSLAAKCDFVINAVGD
jgi:hypothetical protein